MTIESLNILENDTPIDADPLNENFEYLEDKSNAISSTLTAYLDSQLASSIGNAKTDVLQTIYPVGSIYIGTMETCPLAALFGTWTKVSEGRVLQGSDNDNEAGSTVEAGLPNITGTWRVNGTDGASSATGALNGGKIEAQGAGYGHNSGTSDGYQGFTFNASKSNTIYGNSTTVQPPAYIVNIWERTA